MKKRWQRVVFVQNKTASLSLAEFLNQSEIGPAEIIILEMNKIETGHTFSAEAMIYTPITYTRTISVSEI